MQILSHIAYARLKGVICACPNIRPGEVCPTCQFDPEKEEMKLQKLRDEMANSREND